MSEEASPPTSQETQPESDLQVQSDEAPSEALTMVTSEAEAPSGKGANKALARAKTVSNK